MFAGPAEWQSIETATGQTYNWVEGSTYVKLPPLFEDMKPEPAPVSDVHGARPLAILGELDHDRPHLPGRFDQEEQPGRRVSDWAIRSVRTTSTPTAPAAATTKS